MRIAVLRKKTIRSRKKVLRARITGTKDATRLSEELQTNKMRLARMIRGSTKRYCNFA